MKGNSNISNAVWMTRNLKRRGKGRKLAWQGAWHENTYAIDDANDAEDADAADFAAGGDMPTASQGGGVSHGQTAYGPAGPG